MSFEIIIEEKAADDIREASDWYFQKSIQAAANFENEIVEAFEHLKSNTFGYREVIQGVKAFPLSIFPYNIYYRQLNEEKIIQIVAVLHTKRNPDVVMKRLSRT